MMQRGPPACQLTGRAWLRPCTRSASPTASMRSAGGHVAAGVPHGPTRRGEQNGGPACPAERRSSRARVTAGARPLAQPFHIGPGFIRAGFHTTGQGMSEHQRGGGLKCAAEQMRWPGRLEPQHPPVLAPRVDLGEFHLTPRLGAQPPGRATTGSRWPAGAGEAPPLAHRPPAGRVAPVWAERAKGKGHSCQTSWRPRAPPAPGGFPGSRVVARHRLAAVAADAQALASDRERPRLDSIRPSPTLLSPW